MRLIDADKLPKYTGYALSASDVAIAVENAPTVDAVPVVRCKDCKHSKGACIDLWGKPAIECITGRTHSRDWFCADGKRKGGDE